MIVPFLQDEVSKTSEEMPSCLEVQVSAIAKDEMPPAFQNIRTGVSYVAWEFAQRFEEAARAMVEQAWQIG